LENAGEANSCLKLRQSPKTAMEVVLITASAEMEEQTVRKHTERDTIRNKNKEENNQAGGGREGKTP